ncbi:DHHC zinc finger membrane protein, putative [Talaromyces stipitatus ATCC 10500]|uniref:Palmitoyltransferase n=1 Tax=Talaromyces stipitatus (strain ATCC 10500 / CBS 375.48 / QM 6759 / NRRL 1006) TaxID=441959 RepID=B8MLM9_TALSN|nr:DHHC zinc finger membrane protein, putative [Talaromyces stipitatus ATCC 10500]EED13892.1 DHHC zinc finger membrane protein, putative [Talaromyces stipitatus ATCC 10500]
MPDSSTASTPISPAFPTPGLDMPRPPSVGGISSRMTDIASEDGDHSVSSRAPTSVQPPQSRRGPPPAGRLSTGNSNALRPGSSSSRMSRISRTHVPSFTPQAFFRPMSSQRLQAHRRPSQVPSEAYSEPPEAVEDESALNRRSLISSSTLRLGAQAADLEIPPSRGTEFTDPIISDRNTSNASPTGNTTIRSLGESVKLLHEREKKSAPERLNINKTVRTGSLHDPPQRSPLSFRSGFLSLQNKNEDSQRPTDNTGRERLSSVTSSSPRSMKEHKMPEPPAKLGKNYEYFTGNTAFWGSGRFQNSRDKPVNIATGILIVLPVGLFLGYSAPWLWHNVSPAIPIIFAYLFYVCFSSFVHASVVDPGIIPRNLHPLPTTDPAADPLTLGPPTTDWVMTKLATSEVDAMVVPVKYCKTCNIWRPPRCYHCRVCDNCVETLDHHCVWLNNCVGRRNYRYFFTFVSSATILALFLLGASLAHVLLYQQREHISFGASISTWRVPFAMVIYGALGAPYPAALWIYHLWLVGRGETTREYLNSHKFAKADRLRPFTQGNVLRNWISVLARPRPPTYLQFKKPYQQGDQRFATQKRKYLTANDIEAQAGMEMQAVVGRNTNTGSSYQPDMQEGNNRP